MRYKFNDFELDTRQFKLYRTGVPVRVEPKVFDLLVYLLENRHRPVTRKEIFENVWRAQPVCNTTLSNHIKCARKVVRDNGEQQRVIATVRCRGYQFIAKTHRVVDFAVLASLFYRYKSLTLATIIIVLVLMAYMAVGHHDNRAANGQINVAILPFNNLTPATEEDAFGIALANQVAGTFYITKIEMQTHNLRLVKMKNADYVLHGSYLNDKGGVVVNVEFLNYQMNEVVWVEKFYIDKKESREGNQGLSDEIVEKVSEYFR